MHAFHSTDDINALVTHVHEQYTARKFKPANDYQYTVLSAFVLQSPSPLSSESRSDANTFEVVSSATGAKCLPTSRYPARGDALHDCHAEVLARRAFVRWLYEEVQRAVHASGVSEWIERRVNGKWQLREGVKLHLYISTAPCGDASTRFLASSQDPTMAALKDTAPPVPPPPGAASRGRNNYSLFGVLRSKPGRADSPPTLCMSCSDKIAVFNVLGVQGALASSIFMPIYFDTIVIGDIPETMRDVVREDCERAFYGRLASIKDLPEPYHLTKPDLHFTDIDFKLSRTALQRLRPGKQPPPSSNESVCWLKDAASGTEVEVLISGVRRGVGPKQRHLQKFRPQLCKIQMFRLHEETAKVAHLPLFRPGTTYHVAKQSCSQYQKARAVLKGPSGPFAGWIVSGRGWESFDTDSNIYDEYVDTQHTLVS